MKLDHDMLVFVNIAVYLFAFMRDGWKEQIYCMKLIGSLVMWLHVTVFEFTSRRRSRLPWYISRQSEYSVVGSIVSVSQ